MNSAALQQKGDSTVQVAKPTDKQQQKLSIKNDAQQYSFSSFPIQTKLTIGSSNDKYEREADAMANQIMSMPQTFSSQPLSKGNDEIQRKCTACNHEDEQIQRKPLMMKSEGGTSIATQALGAQSINTIGSGTPLPSGTQFQTSGESLENNTRMPDQLKSGLEQLSGHGPFGCTRSHELFQTRSSTMRWHMRKVKTSTWVRVKRSICPMKVGMWCNRCKGA